jgi:HK97 family phage major capsid protein
MKMDTRHALMAAAAMPLHVQLETKEVGDPDLKAAVDELGKVITDFRKKHDDEMKEVKAGREDVLTKTDLEKINKAIDDAIANVKKTTEELEAKTNRLQLAGGAEAAIEAKHAVEFGKLIGNKDFTPEQLGEYKAALETFLRNPEKKTQTLMVGSDPAGGYLVTPDKTGRIVKKVYETTPMRQLANVVTIGTDALEGPIDNGEADAAWAGETTTRAQTDTPQLGVWRIEVKELYAYPWTTQKLLEDATIDVEGWISNKAADKFARKENTAFISGDGVLQPRGLTDYATAETADDTRAWGVFQIVKTGTNGSFGATTNGSDKLLDLIFELKAAYRARANFLMARRTMAGARKLKDGQGNYAYGLGLREGALVETIFGFQVYDGEDMPAFTTNGASAIAFGDFNEAYTIVDRLGITVIRDNITKPGFVKYHMRKRTGGGAVNFEAVKFLNFAA